MILKQSFGVWSKRLYSPLPVAMPTADYIQRNVCRQSHWVWVMKGWLAPTADRQSLESLTLNKQTWWLTNGGKHTNQRSVWRRMTAAGSQSVDCTYSFMTRSGAKQSMLPLHCWQDLQPRLKDMRNSQEHCKRVIWSSRCKSLKPEGKNRHLDQRGRRSCGLSNKESKGPGTQTW